MMILVLLGVIISLSLGVFVGYRVGKNVKFKKLMKEKGIGKNEK